MKILQKHILHVIFKYFDLGDFQKYLCICKKHIEYVKEYKRANIIIYTQPPPQNSKLFEDIYYFLHTSKGPFKKIPKQKDKTYKLHYICTDIQIKKRDIDKFKRRNTKVYHLDLSKSKKVSDLSAFKETSIITFRSNVTLSDHVSNLHMIKELSIPYCQTVLTISNLNNLEILCVYMCLRLTTLSFLPKLKILNARKCKNLRIMNNIGDLCKVDIGYCKEIKDFSFIKTATEIDLTGTCIRNVDIFKNAKYINLTKCLSVYDVSSLKDIDELNLQDCRNIQDVNCLTNVNKLNLCDLIKFPGNAPWPFGYQLQKNWRGVANPTPDSIDISMLITQKISVRYNYPKLFNILYLKRDNGDVNGFCWSDPEYDLQSDD
jgi:hypothetical protein